MSHPDPCYDPDNSYEDDMNYDDYNDFFDEEDDWDDSYDDSMDGDAESAFGSCGWGVDEYYEHNSDYGDE